MANKAKGEVVLGQQTGWLSPGCGGSVRPLRWKQQQPHEEVPSENDLTVKLCNPSGSGERYIHAHNTKVGNARGTRDRCSRGLCSTSSEGPQNRISQQALFHHDKKIKNKNRKRASDTQRFTAIGYASTARERQRNCHCVHSP